MMGGGGASPYNVPERQRRISHSGNRDPTLQSEWHDCRTSGL